MKKIICFTILLISLALKATDYRVTRISNPPIKIGNKTVTTGDIVTGDDIKSIEWGSNNYVRITELLPGNKSGRSFVITKKAHKKSSTSNISSVIPLSSRETQGGNIPVIALRDYLSQTFYLLNDSTNQTERITVATDLTLDNSRHIEAQCSSHGVENTIKLPADNGVFYFTPGLFKQLISPESPSTDIRVKLYYIDTKTGLRQEITTSMNIVIIKP